MAILKFRQISLADWQTLEVKDPDTRYIVYNEDESIYGEFIGEEKVTKEVEELLSAKVDKNNAITAGTSPKITYDTKGLVTGGSDLIASDIPDLEISKITGLQTTLETLETSKQDKLVAGDNITIVGNTISASGGNGGGSSDPDALLASNQEAKTSAFTEPVAVDVDGKLWSKAGSGGGGEVDLNEMAYFDYAGSIYSNKYSLLANAWQDMKEVDKAEIERDSTWEFQYGTLQYPNGEDNGVIIPDSVTSIGSYAFWYWTSNDQPLVIPNSVTSIGDSAFGGWTSNNQPLVIPDSVTSIGIGAFSEWTSNNQPLVIPDSVTSIGYNAFAGWTNVPYVEMKRETPPTLVNSNAFDNQNDAPIYVPDGSVTAYKNATNWSALANRIFPVSEKTGSAGSGEGGGGEVDLDEMAYFDYAGSIYGAKYSLLANAWQDMKEVDGAEIERSSTEETQYGILQYPNGEYNGVIIPDSVTSIGDWVFYGWAANNQPLVIPNSVTSIGNIAFAGWEANNQPLVIPNNLTSIGEGAFAYWAANNQPLVIPNNLTSIGGGAFGGWMSNNQPLVIPDSVTSIGGGAFSEWTANNQPLVIPDSVTSIGDMAFESWTSNNQPLVIPDSVTSIGDWVFSGWQSNNQPLVIPDSVTSIGNGAFWGWSNVPYIEMKSETPPTLVNADAFDNQNDAPIYVPDGSVTAYKNATNWSALASRIFPMSEKPGSAGSGEGGGIDLDEIGYLNHAAKIFYDSRKQNQFKNAWEDMKEVDGAEIERTSSSSTQYGKLQYPNGEDNGVIIPNSATSIGDYAFLSWDTNNQPLVIPNSVTSIGYSAFYNWTANNQPLVIPNSVTSISEGAFGYWESNNQLLVIPNSVTIVGNQAFANWTANNQPLVIPNSVTSISGGAFGYWTANNQPLVIPNSVTSISGGVFAEWTSNNQPLVIPNSVTSIGEAAFANWTSNDQQLVIPNSVTIVGNQAFMNWTANNQPLVIPNSVTSISDGAFANWTANNQPLVIPNSVTSISGGAFNSWSANNQPLVIPNSVTTIGDYAFYNWFNVPYVEMKSETPPTLVNSNAFFSQNDAPIYVPDSAVDAYKNATNWAALASRIFSISDKVGVLGDIDSALDLILGV